MSLINFIKSCLSILYGNQRSVSLSWALKVSVSISLFLDQVYIFELEEMGIILLVIEIGFGIL